MNRYLLLRDNQEMGPYTMDELVAMRVQASDLITIDGTEKGWRQASEIDDLKEVFTNRSDRSKHTEDDRSLYTSLPLFQASDELPKFEDTASATAYYRPQTESGFTSTGNKEFEHTLSESVQKAGNNRFVSRFSWAFISIGILIAAVLITKMVRINNEELVRPKKLSTKMNMPKEVLDNTENFQNALTKEIVMIPDSAAIAEAKKAKARTLKKLVTATNNDYRVSIFGGINDLEITVANNSPYLLDKVTVKLDYLKRNGDVLKSDTLSVRAIRPQGSKSIEVNPYSRGVKIQHKILTIQSHENKISMLHT